MRENFRTRGAGSCPGFLSRLLKDPLTLSLWFDKLTRIGAHPELVEGQAHHEENPPVSAACSARSVG